MSTQRVPVAPAALPDSPSFSFGASLDDVVRLKVLIEVANVLTSCKFQSELKAAEESSSGSALRRFARNDPVQAAVAGSVEREQAAGERRVRLFNDGGKLVVGVA